MKIIPVTPVPAAAKPSHPDHARWVKDRTLAMEANHHATFREAETANIIALERLASRKQKPLKPKKARKIDTSEQLAKQGVTVKAAKPRKLAPLPACKLCKKCVWCKRSLRMSQIARRAKEQDLRALNLQLELVAVMMAASRGKDYKDAIGRELPFSRIKGHDVDKAVTQGIEWVCDRSVSFMGQWR